MHAYFWLCGEMYRVTELILLFWAFYYEAFEIIAYMLQPDDSHHLNNFDEHV